MPIFAALNFALFLLFCLMEAIIQLDQQVFEWINHDLHNYWMDLIMPYWRDKLTWAPLYLLAVVYLLWAFRLKGLVFILAVALTIGVSDQTSSELIKKNVKRVRPCNDLAFNDEVLLLVPCGGGYSFTSSHATNHFALAMFIALTFGARFRRIRLPLFLWAASIAFGQVYVGVHYPLDILAGAVVGMLIGYLMYQLYKKYIPPQLSVLAHPAN